MKQAIETMKQAGYKVYATKARDFISTERSRGGWVFCNHAERQRVICPARGVWRLGNIAAIHAEPEEWERMQGERYAAIRRDNPGDTGRSRAGKPEICPAVARTTVQIKRGLAARVLVGISTALAHQGRKEKDNGKV